MPGTVFPSFEVVPAGVNGGECMAGEEGCLIRGLERPEGIRWAGEMDGEGDGAWKGQNRGLQSGHGLLTLEAGSDTGSKEKFSSRRAWHRHLERLAERVRISS